MKRILLLIASLLFFVHQASAQFSAGLIAGMGFSEPRFAQVDVSSPADYHFGLTGTFDLPMGFSIQPSIVFAQKDAFFKENINICMSYVEMPVSFQWGPDLLIFRPFVDVTPFVGGLLKNKVETMLDGEVYGSGKSMGGRQFLEYGCGVGGGIDVWKLRLVARYNWNLGSIFNGDRPTDLGKIDINDHFKGLTLSLSIFLF